jgi:hypothetical protein
MQAKRLLQRRATATATATVTALLMSVTALLLGQPAG